jgi:hypothetical protein
LSEQGHTGRRGSQQVTVHICQSMWGLLS